jgi:hypothetical protein
MEENNYGDLFICLNSVALQRHSQGRQYVNVFQFITNKPSRAVYGIHESCYFRKYFEYLNVSLYLFILARLYRKREAWSHTRVYFMEKSTGVI